MALSRIGVASGTNTATMPTHAAGDLILVAAYRDGSNTPPSVPTGAAWDTVQSGGANTNSAVFVQKIAASGSETVGTFTNATSLFVEVWRDGVLGAVSAISSGSSTSVAYPALSLQRTDGTSMVSGVAGHRSVNTSLETPPTGMTNVSTVVDATDEAALHETTSLVSSWAGGTVSVGGTSSGWIAFCFEVREKDSGAAWATARAAAAANTTDAYVACLLDSRTAGANGVKVNSPPDLMAAGFSAAPVSRASFFGDNNMAAVNASYDPELVVGSAWALDDTTAPNAAGAAYYASDGAGTALTFTRSGVSFDTIDVYHGVYSGGPTIPVTRDGGTAVHSLVTNSGTDGVAKTTLTPVPLATHTIEFQGTVAGGFINGAVLRSSAEKRVHFLNMGCWGYSTAQMVSAGVFDMFAAFDLINPNLVVFDGTPNNIEVPISAADYRAHLTRAFRRFLETGSVLVVRPAYSPTADYGSEASQDTYYDNAELVANAMGCMYLDMRDYTGWTSNAAQISAGFMDADLLHHSTTGNQDRADKILGVIDAAGAQDITGALYTNSQTFYGATVGRGAVGITGALVTNAQTFYGATVAASYAITGGLLTNTQTFYQSTVTPGSVTITGALFSNAQSFPAATITRGAVDIAGALYTNGQTFFGATVSQASGAQDIAAGLFTNVSEFYGATVEAAVLPPVIEVWDHGGGIESRYDRDDEDHRRRKSLRHAIETAFEAIADRPPVDSAPLLASQPGPHTTMAPVIDYAMHLAAADGLVTSLAEVEALLAEYQHQIEQDALDEDIVLTLLLAA